MPGKHNALNALVAFAIGKELNIDQSKNISDLLVVKEMGHLEIDGERYMIIPASLLERFSSSCLPHAPDMSETDWIQCPKDWSKPDISIMSLLISSIIELFSSSERAVYITGLESWEAYLRAYMLEQGWGDATVITYDPQSYDTTLTFSKTPLTPFSIGLAAGIWERAHGRKLHLNLQTIDCSIQVKIRSLLEYENAL